MPSSLPSKPLLEAANIPNSNPIQLITAMNANQLLILQAFNNLQTQVVASYNTMVASHHAVMARLDLVPMRGHNGAATASSTLHYPPGIVAGDLLPVTLADALALKGPEYFAAINHLITNNAPGLAAVPANASAQMLIQLRATFLEQFHTSPHFQNLMVLLSNTDFLKTIIFTRPNIA
ncbi:hypothetical protein K438DRAFT_2014540 [Mycena galopus ATCC 62051]|nr:hypothetical protein K438DRAFT_2014540 [Mycena galopus ATCC 62051]